MSLIKNIFSFYISSNLHIAFAIFCITKITLLAYDIDDNLIPLFNFFSTLLVYNFIRFYQIYGLNFNSKQWVKNKSKSLILLNAISIVVLIYFAFQIRFQALVLLSPFVLAAIFYVVPLSLSIKNLRSVASLKLFLIAITCAGVTVLFPLIENSIQFSFDVWILFIQRFLLIIAITIPFDIRDVHIDSPDLRTLPQTIGIKKSKIIGSFSLLIFFALGFLIIPIDKTTVLITFLVSLVSFLFLIFSSSNQGKYYSSFWVESIPIYWFILVVVF